MRPPKSGYRAHRRALPERVGIVRSNLLYVEKKSLPPAMLNRLLRLAAFQNPEFYKSQAMRLSTYGKPRIISCWEDFLNTSGCRLGLPGGRYGSARGTRGES